MSVENPENQGAQATEHQKLVNGEQPQQNGFSNGHSDREGSFVKPKDKTSSSSSHKSSSKDKHRDKDRDKERSKDRSSSSSSSGHRDKEKSSSHKSDKHDKDRKSSSSSSSSKDKDRSSSSSSSHKSSSKDKHRDKDRKEGEKSSSSSSSKDKEHKSSSSSHKSSSKDKHRDKERSSSDKSKDKERSGDKSSSSSSRDKDKEHKSSSSSSSKDKHRSSDKHSSSSSSHKSSSKDKERSSSSSHKSSSKDKHRSDEKKREEKPSNEQPQNNGHEIKEEMSSPSKKQYELQMESMQQDCHVSLERVNFDDLHGNNPVCDPLDVQNASQASSCDYNFSQFRTDEPNFVVKEEASESEEEKPLSMRGKAAVKQYDEDSEEEIPLSKRKKAVVSDSEEEEDKPLSMKMKKVKKEEPESEEEIPLAARKKPKGEKKRKKKKGGDSENDEEESYDEKPKKKKIKKEKQKESAPVTPQKGGRKKKEEEPEEVWKWWEEEKRDDGVKWHFLEHKGPLFAPEYEPLPKHVKFVYDGKEMKLSQDAEEIAGFYGKMLESDYCEKKVFNDNFFADWRKAMTKQEREIIKDFKKCNFKYMHAFFKEQSEKNKQRTKEEKLALKQKNEEIMKEYGVCIIDSHKEKIGNFRIEPPGLFRGRGEHPKMGMLKKRVMPEDVIINCSKDSKWPEPPKGHRWKEVRHDNTVTWLASWIENVQGQGKYVMLNPSSKLKGEKDWQKYETARRLLKHIDKIRSTYREEWKSKEMRIRQRAVALYFIDKLALRAGNEKDDDQADTVGCCSLRVEHVDLFKEKDGKENIVVFDFLGKDSIRYYNEVEVEKRVFKNLELFKENKKEGDDLFDRLNTSVLNEHLRDLMEGLTAKVFRTFNASYTLQKQLQELTDPDATVPEKLLAYNRANRAVAILCNHQRSVPKTHQKSMETLKEKIRLKREAVDDCEQEYKDLKRGNPALREKKKKQLDRLKEQLQKLELQETDRDENKTIALGTSKLNYLDPRISVAWCKKHGVPIEKIFNKTQRDKFRWAIDMADENYVF
ncbi:DNA topoisomerase I, mitochondrial [Culicoides brevitarsis]|uniref:DNA topoisomerase I, mitochondrial n=1 Tax=Culicoides brevitarsis TaxID=469753 RepID=UPI00307C3C95